MRRYAAFFNVSGDVILAAFVPAAARYSRGFVRFRTRGLFLLSPPALEGDSINVFQSMQLRELYVRHAAELRRFLSSRLRCDEAAADLTHEVFVRLSGQSNAQIRNPLAFAYRIARNLVVDHYRSRQGEGGGFSFSEEDEVSSAAPGPEEVAAIRQRLSRVEAAVAELSPQCRRAFVLNRFEGLAQNQVAAHMGISRQMVERHIARALQHLRSSLDEPGNL